MTTWLWLTAALVAGTGWVDGPAAPTSTAPLPPATAPRDGEPTQPRPTEVLVVPERPPEDTRVDVVSADLFGALPDLRLSTTIDRRTMSRSAVLDLESFLKTAAVPGLVVVPTSAGAAFPVARGLQRGQLGLVVDGVPVVDGFGLVAPTEFISLVGAASLTLRHGARAFSPTTSSLGGVLEVDTGGDLTDMGESGRTDGLLAAGIGGADLEKGVTSVLRTGWRRARVIGHATLLHRDDQRPGRTIAGIPSSTSSTAVLDGTAGAGVTAGVRVDLVPISDARVFVSWLSGRGVDVSDPTRCGALDLRGRVSDCTRTLERGVDLAVVGFDVARRVDDLVIMPNVRVHLQRALSNDDRFGVDRDSIDLARDEVVRGGVSVGSEFRLAQPLLLDVTPSLDVAVDLYADRGSSFFATRSLRPGDRDPGEGRAVPAAARFVDGTVARQGIARARLRLDHAVFALETGARLQLASIHAPEVGEREAVDVDSALPAVDVTGRMRFTSTLDGFVSVGSVARGPDVGALVTGPSFNGSSADTSMLPRARNERFVELGIAQRHPAIDIDLVGFGAIRDIDSGDDSDDSDDSDGVVGVEGRFTIKPALDGLTATATLAAVLIDEAVFTDHQGVRAGVLQPQTSLAVHYQPTALPFGLYARVTGALPQTRLSKVEEEDPALCPERAVDGVVDPVDCSGVAGFALVDVGAFVQLGALRFDIGGDNLLDQQGTWRAATLGTGGAAARARIGFLF